MKNKIQSTALIRNILLLTLLSTLMTTETFAGGEHYQVFLNDKLIYTQGIPVLDQTISLKNISLENAKPEDRIRIVYRRCHDENSTGRKITIRDAAGKLLREWRFEDHTDNEEGMTILVKDLMSLNSKGGTLHIEYASAQTHSRTLLALSLPDRKKPNF